MGRRHGQGIKYRQSLSSACLDSPICWRQWPRCTPNVTRDTSGNARYRCRLAAKIASSGRCTKTNERIKELAANPGGDNAWWAQLLASNLSEVRKVLRLVRAVGVEPTRAVKPCGFSYRLRLSPPERGAIERLRAVCGLDYPFTFSRCAGS